MDYEYLRSFLKKQGITRSEFARAIGVNVYTVNNWFGRKPKRFPIDQAVKIATVYHIDLEKLIGGEAASEWMFQSLLNSKTNYELAENRATLNQIFDTLNTTGQEKAIDAVDTISKVPEYRKDGGNS